MKTLSRLVLIGITGTLASCGGANNSTSGSSSLADEIVGTYARESSIKGKSTYDGQPYTSELRDTITITKKDEGFEVRDSHWKKTIDKDGKSADPNGLHGNGDTFQGTFIQKDTTITNPLGGAIKLLLDKHQLYPVGHPELLFTKVK